MTSGGAFETTVPVGSHQIEVRAEGHNTFRGSVSVVADDTAEVTVELVEGDEDEIIVGPELGTGGASVSSSDGAGANWPAIVSFAFAGIGAALTITSWIVIDGINGDQGFQDDKTRVGATLQGMGLSSAEIEGTDACQYMRDSGDGSFTDSVDKCDQGNLWTALQYVFLGVAGVGLAAGIVFMVTSGDEEEEPSTVSILPSIGPNRGSVTARVTF